MGDVIALTVGIGLLAMLGALVCAGLAHALWERRPPEDPDRRWRRLAADVDRREGMWRR